VGEQHERGGRGWQHARQMGGELLLRKQTWRRGESERWGVARVPGCGGGRGSESGGELEMLPGVGAGRRRASARTRRRASPCPAFVEEVTQIPPRTKGGTPSAARARGRTRPPSNSGQWMLRWPLRRHVRHRTLSATRWSVARHLKHCVRRAGRERVRRSACATLRFIGGRAGERSAGRAAYGRD
jgi:hypothetical protein